LGIGEVPSDRNGLLEAMTNCATSSNTPAYFLLRSAVAKLKVVNQNRQLLS